MADEGSSTPRPSQRDLLQTGNNSLAPLYFQQQSQQRNLHEGREPHRTSSSISDPLSSGMQNLNLQSIDNPAEAEKNKIQSLLNQAKGIQTNPQQINYLNIAAQNSAPFADDDPRIKEEIVRIIEQWLTKEGLNASALVLNGETRVKRQDREQKLNDCRLLRRAILDGEWNEVERLIARPLVRSQTTLMYSIYKQQFLEHIEHRESQKAFTLLTKRLKALEHYQPQPNEFRDLCYLLSARSVLDAASFKGWEGIQPGREKVVEQLQKMLDRERQENDDLPPVPPDRLLHLLKQAAAYQIGVSKFQTRNQPLRFHSLLQDYQPLVIPNIRRKGLYGHDKGVKCATFIGEAGRYLASGSGDGKLHLWDIESGGNQVKELTGHSGRIWDIAANAGEELVATAAADKTIKLWRAGDGDGQLLTTLGENRGDVYSVCLHPGARHVAAAGYDKIVRLYDTATSTVLKTFTGHSLGVSDVVVNPLGNLLISGSKDATIRIWDVVSGLCIRSITSQLGEVTSVRLNEAGNKLLTSSKDNAHRLWDTRMLRTIIRFKGHQNTSKNFIKADFLNNSLIGSGSEDGMVYVWDEQSSDPIQVLEGHDGVSYRAEWNNVQGTLATCGDDGSVNLWGYDQSKAPKI